MSAKPVARAVLLAASVALAGCAPSPVSRDAEGRPRLERAEAPAAPTTAGTAKRDIIEWTRQGVAPAAINERLRQASPRIPVDGAVLADLRGQGVDAAVLDYLVDADRRARETDFAEEATRRLTAEARLREQQQQQARLRFNQSPYRTAPWGTWPGPYDPRFGTGLIYRQFPWR